ncbi:hypothetical protein GEMRC1_013824 [Eukaryota sp. GEM-RC1]
MEFSMDTTQTLRVFLKEKLDKPPNSYIIRTSAPDSVRFPLVCTDPHSLNVMYRSHGIQHECEDLDVHQVFPIVQNLNMHPNYLPSKDSNYYIIVEEPQSNLFPLELLLRKIFPL